MNFQPNALRKLEILSECAFQKCVNMNDRPLDRKSGISGRFVRATQVPAISQFNNKFARSAMFWDWHMGMNQRVLY